MHENELKNIIWSPDDYLSAAVVAREAGRELLSRLELMTIKPEVILDAGCATGEVGKDLQAFYPQARVIALDQSAAMLNYVRREHKLECLQADAGCIPLTDQAVDMLLANLLLSWSGSHEALLAEWRRVLRVEGILMFSALGLDTLKAWQPIFAEELKIQLMDMHDIGDLLLQCGFSDPVVDVSYITLSYQDPKKFIMELRASGMLARDVQIPNSGPCEAVFEVIYGHAFVAEKRQTSEDGVTYIPISQLRRRLGRA